jgi:transposase
MSISEEEHREIMFWYKKGLVDKMIGKKVDRTRRTILNWRKKHALKANGKKEKISDNKIAKITLYNQKGFSITEIASKVNCSTGSVYYWINKNRKNNDK